MRIRFATILFVGACILSLGAAPAQPFLNDDLMIAAGTPVWVSPLGMDDRWQKGVVLEERLHHNSYLVRTDQYRDEAPQTYNVHWTWVQRLQADCTPLARGKARIGADKC
jgi:hypothetical protein